jgi:tRNA pseudouridine55 synthase
LEVREIPDLKRKDIETVLKDFCGEITQIPPMYSALKHKGQRLYQLAYQGIDVERQPRTVKIYELTLVDFRDEQIDIEVKCSKGTYIRTLAEDIGNKLGCGAHISVLRRLGVSTFIAEQMTTAAEIEQLAELGLDALDQRLLPMDSALNHLSAVKLAVNVAYYLNLGQAVVVPRAPTHGLVRIYDNNDLFLGIGEVLDDGRITPRRLIRYEVNC